VSAFKKVTKKLVGELLIDSGVITRAQLTQALERKKETGRLLGESLVELGFASEQDVVGVVAAQYRIPYLPLKSHDVDKELLKTLPRELVVKHRCFPVDRIGAVTTVAMENPLDEKAIGEIRQAVGGTVLCFVSTPSEILSAIEQHYGAGEARAVRAAVSAPQPPPVLRQAPPPDAADGAAFPEAEPAVEEGIKVFQIEEDALPEE
jgi:type IV pilus assembly protein PilB